MTVVLASRVRAAADDLVAALDGACAVSAPEGEMVEALREYGSALDRLDAVGVQLIAQLSRRGVFAGHGYRNPAYPVAELLGWDHRPARRRVRVAEAVCPRVGLDGQVLPALFPATGTVFAEGAVSVAHAEAITAVLDSPAARRLDPETWAGAEEQVAGYAATGVTPAEVTGWARQLLDALDQDGPEPAVEPEQANELHLTRHRSGTGGRVRGELDGPTFEAVFTAIGALAKPRPDIHRELPQRQADALGEICEHALRHDTDLPETGGERPQVRLTLDWERLRAAVAGASLDTGAWYSPGQLRMLACDCGVVPAVLGSNTEPLDVGRLQRSVTAAIRRAVTIRDRGCAYPGCDRPPQYCDIHHITHWVDGGDTSLQNCVMLCRAHHGIIHHTEWTIRIRNGHPEFTPPELIDPHQRSRRKPLILRT